MRIAVYTDYTYHLREGEPHAERAFAVFIASLASSFERLAVLGRLDPTPARSRYPLGPEVDFVALPYYRSLADPWSALRSMGAAAWRFWKTLGAVDAVWLLGPNPFAIAFALLAWLRRKKVVLGVRQDYPEYIRARHPGRRGIQALAALLDAAFHWLARFCPVVVVGPQLKRAYGDAPSVLEIAVSLVDADRIRTPADVRERSYEGELRVLSVGRLEEEKNPLLLAAVLRRLRSGGRSWRLLVCGEGPMRGALEAELDRLGVAEDADLLGYVPHDQGLAELYESSHALLHVSWTEGLPQVLLEAFAAALPAVATDVGGVREAVGDAVRLVPAGDPESAAAELEAIAANPALRAELVGAGNAYVSERTLARESSRVAAFIGGGAEVEA